MSGQGGLVGRIDGRVVRLVGLLQQDGMEQASVDPLPTMRFGNVGREDPGLIGIQFDSQS